MTNLIIGFIYSLNCCNYTHNIGCPNCVCISSGIYDLVFDYSVCRY